MQYSIASSSPSNIKKNLSNATRAIDEENKFIDEYLKSACSNEPHLFDTFDIKTEWPILAQFLNKPKKRDFLKIFGNKQEVRVSSTEIYETMPLSKFIDACNTNENLYLKDWHAALNYREINSSDLYKLPNFLLDDWLDFWCKRCKNDDDDYRFVYVGTKNTTTKLHYDVCLSYSWSINLTGAKVWKLYKPINVIKACNFHNVEEFTEILLENQQVRHVTIKQGIGQILFVPSGWYHSVTNVTPSECTENLNITSENEFTDKDKEDYMDVTMSVNQNWFNGFNIYDVWRFLLNDLNSCRRELKHLRPFCLLTDKGVAFDSVKEWCQHCDTILAANSKLNILDLLELIASRLFDFSRYIATIKKKTKNDMETYNEIDTDLFDPYQTASWTEFLCNNYLSTETIDTVKDNEKINTFLMEHMICTKDLFFECDCDMNQNRLLIESLRISPADEIDISISRSNLSHTLSTTKSNKLSNSIQFPEKMSIFEMSVLQIIRIISEMKDSDSMMEHVDSILITGEDDCLFVRGSGKDLLEMIVRSAKLLLSKD